MIGTNCVTINRITFIIFIGTLFPTPFYCYAQNWLPLDKGIGISWADISHIEPDSNFIYISGSFTEDGNGIPMRGLAKWDGYKWDSVGDANKFNATKLGICKFNDTLLTSAIFYDWPYGSFAKLKGDIWEPFPNTRDLSVRCCLEKDGILYLGGYFYQCGNDSTYLIGKYDGTVFSGMTPLYDNHSSGNVVWRMVFFQDTLYVGGLFYLFPQLPIAGLAKWDGANLVPVSPEFSTAMCGVEALAVYKNELYVGGLFRKSSGFTGDYIMRWDGNNFFEVGGGANEEITAMTVYNDELYVAGSFTQIGGITSKNIAKWDGTQWTSLNMDDFNPGARIKDICIFNDYLYVAGYFRMIGNDSLNSIAKYNHPLSVNNGSDNGRKFTVYPSPATNQITIEFDLPAAQDATIEIRNVLGQIVMTDNYEALPVGRNNIILDIGDIPTGLYFVVLQLGDLRFSGKFVKE